MVILGMALVAATLPPGMLWPDDPLPYDVLEYHLQGPREWYEAGRIEPLRHNVYTFFPFNVEMQFLLAMHLRGGPWAGMYLAQLMHVAYVALNQREDSTTHPATNSARIQTSRSPAGTAT